jgi:hypothetical protein
MLDRPRTQSGKFAVKSDEPRHVRSIRLTDSTWEKLGQLADEKSTSERCITRADLIEEWMQDNQVLHGQLELFAVGQSRQSIKIDWDKLAEESLYNFWIDAKVKKNQLPYKAAKTVINALVKAIRLLVQ